MHSSDWKRRLKDRYSQNIANVHWDVEAKREMLRYLRERLFPLHGRIRGWLVWRWSNFRQLPVKVDGYRRAIETSASNGGTMDREIEAVDRPRQILLASRKYYTCQNNVFWPFKFYLFTYTVSHNVLWRESDGIISLTYQLEFNQF